MDINKLQKEQEKIELLYEIIVKQIGMIEPYGSTEIDKKRYNNLGNYEYLINSLLFDMSECIKYKNDSCYSRNKIGSKVYEFFQELKEYIEDCLKEGEN